MPASIWSKTAHYKQQCNISAAMCTVICLKYGKVDYAVLAMRFGCPHLPGPLQPQ